MMTNRLSLQPKLELQQRITQQQILRAELLQIPLLDLVQRVEVELDQNPLLELVDPDEPRTDEDWYDEKPVGLPDVPENDLATNDAASIAEEKLTGDFPTQPEEESQLTDVSIADKQQDTDWEQYFRDEDYSGGRLPAVTDRESDDERSFEYRSETNFLDGLHEQLNLDPELSDLQREIGEQFIGSLNSTGYLSVNIVAEIVELLDAEPKEVEWVLAHIQAYDPPGIFSRSLKESLTLQLKRKVEETINNIEHRRIFENAQLLVETQFDLLTKRHFEQILEQTSMSDDDFKAAFHAIQTLQPTPGIGKEGYEFVTPELRVTAQLLDTAPPGRIIEYPDGRKVFIYLNDATIPDIRISKRYRSMFQDKNLDSKTKAWIEQKFDSARNFVKAVQSRHNTMLDVMEWIVRLQPKFFLSGTDLVPLTQLEVARQSDRDNSTVSRAIKDKYVETDFGTFPLRHFFSVGLETDTGEDVSTREIKLKLTELIENENKQHPLTDQALCDKLNELGFRLARRTVQKYREQLGIPLARFRRSL